MVGVNSEWYCFLSMVAILSFLYSVSLILNFQPLKENTINYDNAENSNDKKDHCRLTFIMGSLRGTTVTNVSQLFSHRFLKKNL